MEALADSTPSANLARFANSQQCTVPFTPHSLDYPNYIIYVNSEHSGTAQPFYCIIRVIAVTPHVYYFLRLIAHIWIIHFACTILFFSIWPCWMAVKYGASYYVALKHGRLSRWSCKCHSEAACLVGWNNRMRIVCYRQTQMTTVTLPSTLHTKGKWECMHIRTYVRT